MAKKYPIIGNSTLIFEKQFENMEMSYGDFYGDDNGIVEINVDENKNKGNILIFSNSYSNPINKLIACEFNKSYIVDLRNYASFNNEEFNIREFLNENKIDKILIIANYKYFKNDKSYINVE